MDRLAAMISLLRHRGPDDGACVSSGPLALGHRRLFIDDAGPAARQPMSRNDGRYWISYNGSISNVADLRRTLGQAGCVFESRSDTEVVLQSFIRDGEGSLDKLNGMFAFAVWDSVERELFLARDPFGIKPLYYQNRGGRFAFASEIKALVATGRHRGKMHGPGIADYLTFQYTLGDKTFFENVHKLMPGHCLRVRADGSIRIKEYWRPRFDKVDDDEEKAAATVRELVRESVRKNSQARVPLGFTLSGGMDSAAIVGLSGNSKDTFSVGFDNDDDLEQAADLARIFAKTHHRVIPTPDDFTENLNALIWHLDEPVAAPGAFAQFMLAKTAGRHVKVLLGGNGADELFGGYTRNYLLCRHLAGTDRTWGDLDRHKNQLRGYEPLAEKLAGLGPHPSPDDIHLALITRSDGLPEMVTDYDPTEEFRSIFNKPGDINIFDKVLSYETRVNLPALLQVDDRTAMAWSVESRVPFLERKIADYSFSLSSAVRFKDGRLKHILRRAMADIVPSKILDSADKIGLPVPLSDWFSGPLRDWLGDFLLDRRTLQRGFLTRRQIISKIDTDSPFDRSLWGLVCLDTWARLFIDGDGFPSRRNPGLIN